MWSSDFEQARLEERDLTIKDLEAENNRLQAALQATIAEKERVRQLAVDYSCQVDGLRMDLQMCENMKLAREFEDILGTTSIPVAVERLKAMTDAYIREGEAEKVAAELEAELAIHEKALELACAKLLRETAKYHFTTPADVESWLTIAKEALYDTKPANSQD